MHHLLLCRSANLLFLHALIVLVPRLSADPSYSFDNSQKFLNQYCVGCHQGKSPAGGFHARTLSDPSTFRTETSWWTRVISRVRDAGMPPKGAPMPSAEERSGITEWAAGSVKAAICGSGAVPGPTPVRRLNRDEYTATIRDLLDIHLDIGRALPEDGAGGEGFDNAAETLFLSPLHSEKYMELAGFAIGFAAKEYKSRARVFVSKPGPGVSEQQASDAIFKSFLPRAFRRPVDDWTVASYQKLYQSARTEGQSFDEAILTSLRAALVSPLFLYHVSRSDDQYAFASRLSYFLWGSMPDELLFDAAAEGQLSDPAVVKYMVQRMLRNDRSNGFVQRFGEQWLRTRELGAEKIPDAEVFPTYSSDEELRSDIRFQPVLFIREVFIRNLSLLNLIDSKYTIGTITLAKHMNVALPINKGARKQPQWVELPEGSHRGGLLGMPAVLAVSSHPYRTSPVLRGAWVLDTILGTPPPAPPPDVPPLDSKQDANTSRSVRERLTQHRENAVCASCHNSIDPLGFALENFDAVGQWREQDAGQPVNAAGELPDGTKFSGPDELKTVLLARKDEFVHNLTRRMLGYALGRGLALEDSCTVDEIVGQLKRADYSAQTLIEAIVMSPAFRFAPPERLARREATKRDRS
ncbi:MAG: DUF1588 domain-containing protein [Bryobacteraceae bacterium]|nr:DUF1588 domain-containing protein [Bryobacteraceae bacterium]